MNTISAAALMTIKDIKVPLFKISGSQTSKICGGEDGLTDKQEETYLVFKDRFDGKEGTKPLTPNQLETYNGLVYKRDPKNWELSAGGKSYVETWYKEQRYERRKDFTADAADKGIIVEDDSIIYINDVLELGFAMKNEERLYGKYSHGIPDVRMAKMVIDAKNNWDCFPFPLFDADGEIDIDSPYWWQGQTYMDLTGVDQYLLVYTLMDLPEEMVEDLVKKESWKRKNKDKTQEELEEIVRRKYMFSGLDDHLRIRVFDFKLDPEAIKKMERRVKLCRKYVLVLKQREVDNYNRILRIRKMIQEPEAEGQRAA